MNPQAKVNLYKRLLRQVKTELRSAVRGPIEKSQRGGLKFVQPVEFGHPETGNSATMERLGDEPSEQLVKKWMLQEVYGDPDDWLDTGGEPMYTELAEAAALFFDVDHWLDDDTHPVWDWSIQVLDQAVEETMEDEYETDSYLAKTGKALRRQTMQRRGRRSRRFSRVLIDDVDVTPHVRGPLRLRMAVSDDPYNRAVERMNAAVCRKGIFSGFQALRNRIKAIKSPEKLQGVAELVGRLVDEIEETQQMLERKY